MKIPRILLLALCLPGIASVAFAQTPLTPEIEVSSAEPGFEVIELSAAMNARGDLAVVWSTLRPASAGTLSPALFARLYAADGTPQTGAVLVSEEPTSAYYQFAVAIRNDGSFLVLYQKIDPDGFQRLKGRLFTPEGTPLGDVFPVAGSDAGTLSVAAREDGGFLVGWTDAGTRISYRLLSSEGEGIGPERVLGFGSEVAVAAGPGDEMAVVWESWSRDNSLLQAVAGQRLRPDGARRGRKLFVNQERRAQIIRPEAAFDREGELLVRWSDRGTRIRRYSPAGAALGKIRRIPSGIPTPGIVMGPEGSFTVASVLSRGAGSVQDLVVQRFRENGLPLEPAVHVSAAGNIRDSAIVGNESGNLVLLWTRDTHVRAKFFSAE